MKRFIKKKINFSQLFFLLVFVLYFEVLKIYEYYAFLLLSFQIDELFENLPYFGLQSKFFYYFLIVFFLNVLLESCLPYLMKITRKNLDILLYFLLYYLTIIISISLFTENIFSVNRLLMLSFVFSIVRYFVIDRINPKINIKNSLFLLLTYCLLISFFMMHNTKDTTLWFEYIFSNNNYFYNFKNIKNDSYDISYLITCCSSDEYASTGAKPGSFLEIHENKIIMTSGAGDITYIDVSKIKNNFINRKKVDSNVRSFLKKEYFSNINKISVRGTAIFENKFYLSYINEPKKDCYNISLLEGEILKSEINFSIFFETTECSFSESKISQNLHQSGGAIVVDSDNVYFAIGEFRDRPKAQDVDSLFGKVLKINKFTKTHQVISSGHRNIQGMQLEDNKIFSSEHGPRGGDEVNEIDLNENIVILNYGWPISSYGEHYDGEFKIEAPLHDSHADYGFIEPKFYFTPSIGISDVKRDNETFVISSMKEKTLYFIPDTAEGNITGAKSINLDYRIRDFIILDGNIIVYLEDLPGMAILTNK